MAIRVKDARITLNSKDLGSSSPKIPRDACEVEEVEVFEDAVPLSSRTAHEELIGGDESPASRTSTGSTQLSQQRRESEDSKESQAMDFILPTQKTEYDKKTLKRLRAKRSFIPTLEALPMAWLKLPSPTDRKNTHENPWRRPLAPAPAPAPQFKPDLEYPTREKKCKRTAPVPDFPQMIRTRTAPITNLTELQDEYFRVATCQARDWVEYYCQNESFGFSMVVVYWASEMWKSLPEGSDGNNGSTLEERIVEWKEDIGWARHAAVVTRRAKRGWAWFKPAYVESLAELFEEALKSANIKVGELGFDTEDEFLRMKNMVLKVCGYCQGQGLYGSKWPWKISWNGGDEDHYERSGRAWKRIVGLLRRESVEDKPRKCNGMVLARRHDAQGSTGEEQVQDRTCRSAEKQVGGKEPPFFSTHQKSFGGSV